MPSPGPRGAAGIKRREEALRAVAGGNNGTNDAENRSLWSRLAVLKGVPRKPIRGTSYEGAKPRRTITRAEEGSAGAALDGGRSSETSGYG